MVRGIDELIHSLKSGPLIAECPLCYEEFALSDALLFDGTKPFPDEAEIHRLEYEDELKIRRALLKKKKTAASERAAITAEAVTIGKTIEHLVPVLDGFRFHPAECRALFSPIDFIVFEGLNSSKVDSLTFLEIKSGNARLNKPQRLIRDAIRGERVSYEEV